MSERIDPERAFEWVLVVCGGALILMLIGAFTWFLGNCLAEQRAKVACRSSGQRVIVDTTTNEWRCAPPDGRPERAP